jgi:hypothetical protein
MVSCLITVVSGEPYERYADQLFTTASAYFRPTETIEVRKLTGRAGWPAATLYRYHEVLEMIAHPYDYLFLCDADMRFEAKVGPEILAPLVAVQHPGYVDAPRALLPYESRPESAAYMKAGALPYFAGGFVGGEREWFLELAGDIVDQVDSDDSKGVTAIWHDESHLNRALGNVDDRDLRVLSPAYCFPDDASGYRWPERYERRLVALDKTPAERGGR